MNMKVGVYCNRQTKKFLAVRDELLKILDRKGISYETYYDTNEIAKPDILIVLGGDGTILKAAIIAGMRKIDLLGINSGNLGFLTEFEGEQVEQAVDLLLRGYKTESRSVLEVHAGSQTFYALNDAVLQRRFDEGADDNVVEIIAEIDGKKSTDLWATVLSSVRRRGRPLILCPRGICFNSGHSCVYSYADLYTFFAQPSDCLFGREFDESGPFRYRSPRCARLRRKVLRRICKIR